ncbi:hypothetical protein BDR03DRAFT_154731 [Suillus americanus]|nr:hypothetical protein BDR03DRAFT_154731 [Suillus americanus]
MLGSETQARHQQSIAKQTTSLAPAAVTCLLGDKGLLATAAGMAAVSNLRKISSGGYSYPNLADHLVLCRNNILLRCGSKPSDWHDCN